MKLFSFLNAYSKYSFKKNVKCVLEVCDPQNVAKKNFLEYFLRKANNKIFLNSILNYFKTFCNMSKTAFVYFDPEARNLQ